ncbi:hypothetical protein C0416_02870 [bacterium]|nr:hypothetical protein [bacterium]
MKSRFLHALLGVLMLTGASVGTVFAQSTADLSISAESVNFSKNTFLEGNPVRIYATIQNLSSKDLLGTVQFYDESAGKQIGSDQTVSVFANKTDDVFIDWTPYVAGAHSITVSIDPWNNNGDDPSNNTVKKTVTVLKDTDYDGITDSEDPDDDNDGVSDEEDAFPLNSKEWIDTDGDRIGDNEDPDDDNDSHLDTEDAFPFNPLEWSDFDKDGTGDNEDNDDDNDKLDDESETKMQTDPLKPDTDEDGVIDGEDAFPLDKNEARDYDKDMIGDNTDTDDDNDGILDEYDSNDNNKGPTIVVDGNTKFAFLNREISLDASPSFDEDGSIQDIQWVVGEEAQAGPNFNYMVGTKGNIDVRIVIIDNAGEIRETTFNIKVLDIDFYLSGAMIWIIIILAIIIFLKYSSRA